MKFHINDKGEAGKCGAEKGKCPFGDQSEHYTSAAAARTAYEAKQAAFASLAAARSDLETYGENASVFNQWSKIHADFKTNSDGVRKVLVNGAGLGTILTPWHGPKVLEQLLKESSIEKAPQIEPTPNMAGWTMTADVMDLERTEIGDRYYDKFGSAFEVAKVDKDARGVTTAAKMRVLDDNGTPIEAVSASGILVGSNTNKASKFYKLTNLQQLNGYTDTIPGVSSSNAITELPKGPNQYPYAAIASLTYAGQDNSPKTIQLITPLGSRLTDKKRIALGRELWAYTGKDPQRYEDVSDEAKLKWANQRIMRQKNFAFDNDGDTVSYSHDNGSGLKDVKNFKLVKLKE